MIEIYHVLLFYVEVLVKNRNLCPLFLSLMQTVQDEVRDMEQELQSVCHMVSGLHPYLTDSAADDVDHELAVLKEQLHHLNTETAQIADGLARALESSANVQAHLTQFDSKLQVAEQSVAELSSMYLDELMPEESTVEVS